MKCANCGSTNLTDERYFNMMFRTTLGRCRRRGSGGARLPASGNGPGNLHQLPERANDNAPQDSVWNRAGRKIVSQRNHAGELHLRTREFEQMEMEYFVKPDAEHLKLVDRMGRALRRMV